MTKVCLAVMLLAALPAETWAAAGAVPAYIGPGAGLGMIGSLLAVGAAIMLGLLGLVLYPLRLLMKSLRSQRPEKESREPMSVGGSA